MYMRRNGGGGGQDSICLRRHWNGNGHWALIIRHNSDEVQSNNYIPFYKLFLQCDVNCWICKLVTNNSLQGFTFLGGAIKLNDMVLIFFKYDMLVHVFLRNFEIKRNKVHVNKRMNFLHNNRGRHAATGTFAEMRKRKESGIRTGREIRL